MKTITRKVISYCDIPEGVTDIADELPCNCFVEHKITPVSERHKYSDDFSLDKWILGTYPEIKEDEIVLIDIDY